MSDALKPQPIQTATLAGGCFWCLEAAFSMLEGVHAVTSGYMGGHLEHPGYEAVCTGTTGHAEVVQIEFDPIMIDYSSLLEVFFSVHDPTTLNRQGNDVGPQYRSAIFWHDADQEAAARAMIERLEADPAFERPIVTELAPASRFWPAEAVHADYYRLHPTQPYCRFVIAPKLDKLRARFTTRLKSA